MSIDAPIVVFFRFDKLARLSILEMLGVNGGSVLIDCFMSSDTLFTRKQESNNDSTSLRTTGVALCSAALLIEEYSVKFIVEDDCAIDQIYGPSSSSLACVTALSRFIECLCRLDLCDVLSIKLRSDEFSKMSEFDKNDIF